MKKAIEHALIMAAGRGSRMIPLTDHIPKAMAKYGESTLIVNGIEKIKKHIPNIHITVGYKKAELAKHVIEHHVSTVINTEGKGNAWWLFNTLMKYVDEPIFLLTCDNIVELDFNKLSESYYSFNSPACMLVPVVPVENLEGDYIFEKNNKVYELDRNKKAAIYCSGIQVLNPAKINRLMKPQDDFNQVWKELIKLDQLYSSDVIPKNWYTIDTVEQLKKANQLKA